MAVFPSWVMFNPREISEACTPVIVRSDMERGVAKQRRVSADTVCTIQITAIFSSSQRAIDFENWFYSEGSGWFDYKHPVTGLVVQGRIVGGDLGTKRPLGGLPQSRFARDLQIEYVRSTL